MQMLLPLGLMCVAPAVLVWRALTAFDRIQEMHKLATAHKSVEVNINYFKTKNKRYKLAKIRARRMKCLNTHAITAM